MKVNRAMTIIGYNYNICRYYDYWKEKKNLIEKSEISFQLLLILFFKAKIIYVPCIILYRVSYTNQGGKSVYLLFGL